MKTEYLLNWGLLILIHCKSVLLWLNKYRVLLLCYINITIIITIIMTINLEDSQIPIFRMANMQKNKENHKLVNMVIIFYNKINLNT